MKWVCAATYFIAERLGGGPGLVPKGEGGSPDQSCTATINEQYHAAAGLAADRLEGNGGASGSVGRAEGLKKTEASKRSELAAFFSPKGCAGRS